MKKSILVSIIMPVYNSGKYLDEAIRCILNQTYRNWELICINDASTDKSGEVLLQYAKQEKRIKVFTNERNQGAANARNLGISLAQGEYLYFVDADDIYENNLLEESICSFQEEFPDLIYIDYDTFSDLKMCCGGMKSWYYYFKKSIFENGEAKEYGKSNLHDLSIAPYGRMYRKEFIQKNNLYFQDIKSSNDVYFSLMSVILSEKSVHTCQNMYLYHVRKHDSAFRISNNRNPFNNYLAYSLVIKELKVRNIWEKMKGDVKEQFFLNFFYEVQTCNKNLAKEYISFLKTRGLKYLDFSDDCPHEKNNNIYKEILKNIFFEKCENEWYRKKPWFYFQIRALEDEISILFSKFEDKGKKCAVWGAGQYGEIFAEFCRMKKCRCEGFIDNNKNKWGNVLSDYTIYAPAQLIDVIDIIIVTNLKWFSGIYEQVSQLREGVMIFSLDVYLKYKVDIDQSGIVTKRL